MKAYLISVILLGLPLRSAYLLLVAKCILREKSLINIKKLKYIKELVGLKVSDGFASNCVKLLF
jgi:hypothetical protein